MDVVVGAVVVVLLAAGGVWALWSRSRSETHSVEGYRHTLEALDEVRTRAPSRAVRVLDRPLAADEDEEGTRTGVQAARNRPPGGPAGARTGPLKLGFDDETPAEPQPARSSARVQTKALHAMNHRPRRLGAPIAATVVVLAVLAAVIAVGARQQPGRPGRHRGAARSATTQVIVIPSGAKGRGSTSTTRAGTTGSGHGHGKGTTQSSGTSKGKSSSTHSKGGRGVGATTSTLPTSFAAVSSTSTTATYAPPANAYSVTVAATNGECWITVSTPSRTGVFTTLLDEGVSHALTLTGPTTLIIGAPEAVTITLDHEPVVLPGGFATPFTITFRPSQG